LQPSERREEVLDAALRVVVRTGDFQATMATIAAEGGVTKPVVYDYFENRDELLAALLDREIERAKHMLAEAIPDLGEIVHADPDEVLVAQTAAFLEVVHRHPETWRFVLMPPVGAPAELRRRIEEGRERAQQALTLVISWGFTTRGGPSGIDVDLFAHSMLAVGQRATELSLTRPEEYPPERVLDYVRGLLAGLTRH
jgi:AcrR family transcriptional regulator